MYTHINTVGNLSLVFHYTGDPTAPPLSLSFSLSSFLCSLSLFSFSLPHFFYFFTFLLFLRYKVRFSLRLRLRPYFHTEFSCEDVFDRKEGEVPVIDETSWEPGHKCGMDLHAHAIEFDVEFWPVEHPMEPQDEDRPVKCPMPAASSINDGKGHEEKVAADSSRKRSELPEMVNKGIAVTTDPPVRAVRKRQHTLTRNHHIMEPLVRTPPLPPLPTQNLTISQMLQESEEFNS